ncbi:PREDICTED: uncharacterized protein LOC109160421 [Ipomoea nil]|uniref:uncharacterized protein LOC109160421 n=1 Tax=Ipomoea nil TaxID=35883 RepID=UPI000901F9C6|nr:PREDICTED: uncharacterized protein LOC109160421 [Ipomoea nil]
MQKQREEDYVIRFLEGLNEDYETIKSGVLVMDPIPEMEKVLNMTLKVERKIKGFISQKCNDLIQSNAVYNDQTQTAEEHPLLAVAASNNRKKFTGNGGKNVPKCTFCGMLGHTVEKFYKKHGYPPGWVAGYKSKNKQVQDTQHSSNAAVNQAGDIGISADQFQKLLSLLQNQNKGNQSSSNAAVTIAGSGVKPSFKDSVEAPSEGRTTSNPSLNVVMNTDDFWIVDSGATDHITCSLDYFDAYERVQGISVKLPNGEIVSVTHIGQIRLNQNILLTNVLYIPSFTFNIISASKLTKQSGCRLVLEADSCAVQAHLGTMDGFARQRDGLYLVSDPPVKKKAHSPILNEFQCNSLSLEVWHNRLGHYPINKISVLNGIKHTASHKCDDLVCDACHFAKHRRSSFQLACPGLSIVLTLSTWMSGVLLLWHLSKENTIF